jgi:hypothetical protein
MTQTGIFFPMIALAMWTLSVLLLIPYQRFSAVRSRRARVDDFKYGESGNVPPEVSLPNRNLMNLLEMPVLFYVACLSLYVTQKVDATAIALAWTYFALRIGHSLVHLTYNRVLHRLTLFALSNLVLSLFWVYFFLALRR